ncbi:hypothetical protein [Thermobaculum terrenum]|uniref:hypothetical protein n=1 Tax=Thermobaculum terrenum TaxID=166501 RepID=UPI00059E7AAA|nr:hypothetical protein [Thermobaculum terrenum]
MPFTIQPEQGCFQGLQDSPEVSLSCDGGWGFELQVGQPAEVHLEGFPAPCDGDRRGKDDGCQAGEGGMRSALRGCPCALRAAGFTTSPCGLCAGRLRIVAARDHGCLGGELPACCDGVTGWCENAYNDIRGGPWRMQIAGH